jgi:hypothetical protein
MGAEEAIKVNLTQDMISAGAEVMIQYRESGITSENLVLAVFRAMAHSHKPRIREAIDREANPDTAGRFVI